VPADPLARLRVLERSDDRVVLAECRAALATDAELARRLAALLWLRHERVVRAVILRHMPELLEDVLADVQERFVRIAYRGETVPGSLPALLATVARRACVDALRRKGRLSVEVAGDENDRSDENDALARLVQGEQRAVLLEPLGERDRVLIAAQLDDEPTAAVAARLGISEGAVWVAQHRARERLRRALEAGS
jgi:RNA polymerase sigma factor (sigma-70 family)